MKNKNGKKRLIFKGTVGELKQIAKSHNMIDIVEVIELIDNIPLWKYKMGMASERANIDVYDTKEILLELKDKLKEIKEEERK